MSTTTDFPNIDCTFSTELTVTPRTLEANYGNGYEQRVGDGLNMIKSSWSVVWEGISWAECLQIDAFLRAQAAVLPFNWTPPGEDPLQVKCKSWRRSKTSATTGNVSAVFEQVFDL